MVVEELEIFKLEAEAESEQVSSLVGRGMRMIECGVSVRGR
jgi:hypothetical protein